MRDLSLPPHPSLIDAVDALGRRLASRSESRQATGEEEGMKRVAMLVGALLVLLVPAQVAHAEERTCRGFIGAITVDNVRVPQGGTCTMQGTYVKGTIKVQTNARLRASNVRVIGNVQAEGARSVNVTNGSSVGGSVQIVQGGGALVGSSRINGDILYDENRAMLTARSNRIGGSLQAFQNTGGVSITSNVIEGNLQCKENVPPPTGGGNIVDGNKEDQCRNL
jgi:hypothetical protein